MVHLVVDRPKPVSYTHLDVYKRQGQPPTRGIKLLCQRSVCRIVECIFFHEKDSQKMCIRDRHSAKYIETEKPGHKIDVVSFVNHLAVQAEQTLEERMLKKNQAGGGQINPHDQERGPHIFADDGFVSALWFFIHIAVQGGFAAQCKRRKRCLLYTSRCV